MMARMNYFVRITRVNPRSGKKFVDIFYQSYECDGSTEVYYSMDYFKEDGEALSADIIQKMIECYEFKLDSKLKTQEKRDTGLVLKLSFLTLDAGTPHWYHGHGGWKLETIQTWPVCRIDIPRDPVAEDNGFLVLLNFWAKVFSST